MNLCLCVNRERCVCSTCCMKILDNMLEEGVPIARPSFWMTYVVVIKKVILFCDDIIQV